MNMEEKKEREKEENGREDLDERPAAGAERGGDAARDFAKEIRELTEKYPELEGNALPDEVVMAAAEGMDLTAAYEAYLKRCGGKRGARERAQFVERQNRSAASRAPVVGVSGGAAVRRVGEDDFLRGFNADR